MKIYNILIIGNISSGKSYLIDNKLIHLKYFADYHIIKIDNYRKIYGDGTFAGEYLSLSYFFKDIENDNGSIIEFTGAGPNKHAVKQILLDSQYPTIVLYLCTELDKCIRQSQNKIWDTPYPWKINPLNIMSSVSEELENDWNVSFWNTFETLKSCNYDEIINYLERKFND